MSFEIKTCGKKQALIPKHDFYKHASSFWEIKLKDGTIKNDLSKLKHIKIGPFDVVSNPDRIKKVHSPIEEACRIDKAHKDCIFDKDEIINNETACHITINDETYNLMVNVFAAYNKHFVLIKPKESSRLSQYIDCQQSIHDLMTVGSLLPDDFAICFNSNSGENSGAGASQNHWHTHICQFGGPIKKLPVKIIPEFYFLSHQGIIAGEAAAWPAKLRIFAGADAYKLSNVIFKYISILNENNNAYNLCLFKYPDNFHFAVLIPRALEIPKTSLFGTTAGKWGGNPFCGYILLEGDPEAFEAVKKDNHTALRVMQRRLEETTLDSDSIQEFDRLFLRSL